VLKSLIIINVETSCAAQYFVVNHIFSEYLMNRMFKKTVLIRNKNPL